MQYESQRCHICSEQGRWEVSKIQRDPKFNFYCIDFSGANVEEHYYFNTVKKGKSLFSILNQK